MLFHKILVTGCGGDIGIAIGRILQETKIADSVVGCDIEEDHAGRVFFDRCFAMESAASPQYEERLTQLIEDAQIDLVIPTSEPELRLLYADHFFGRRALFLMANDTALEIGFDKYKTAEFLQAHGLPHPWTQRAADGAPRELPCILKSRTGCGSKDVRILTAETYREENAYHEDDIFQEWIAGDEEEYTCGLFRSVSDEIRTIILRRRLREGRTVCGAVEENPAIEALLSALAKALNLRGSINVQLRLRDGVPYVFEINPRFSSTVRFRHQLGFSDLLWSVQDVAGHLPSDYVPPRAGLRFYKIYEDVIDWQGASI